MMLSYFHSNERTVKALQVMSNEIIRSSQSCLPLFLFPKTEMRSVLLVACVLLITLAAAGRRQWFQLDGYTFEQYVREFRKPYKKGTSTYEMRKNVFLNKLKDIQEHNADHSQTWKKGVNEFSDMTPQEWKAYNKAFKNPNRPGPLSIHLADDNVPLPHEVDYRTWTSPRVLSNVKHQGSCGNCWAHGCVETMEAYYALLTGQSAVFSTQQVTSCDTFSAGCDGGDPAGGFMYINSTRRGLTEEWAYPFVDFFANVSNETTSVCKNISTEYPSTPYTWYAYLSQAGATGYTSVNSNDARAHLNALATRGPLSILVAAGNWQDYETGVFQNTAKYGNSSEWQIDHAVQMVGYGHDKELGHDYWIVRNSWGTMWGEDGFIRLDRPAVEPCSPSEFGPVCGTSGCLCDSSYPWVHNNTAIEF
jgi:cathepsin L